MRVCRFAAAVILASGLAIPRAAWAQEMPGMQQEHHHHGEIPTVRPVYPRMGRAAEQAKGALFSLEEAQRIAAQSNPTMRQAEAEIRAAKERERQAGLYPNPMVGYTGDEIRGGSVNGGKQGFFLQQTIVTGGKLGRSREVFAKQIHIAEIEAEEQKLRIENAVKIAYWRVLASQELLELRRDLQHIAQDYAETQRRLVNTGQVDEPEALDAEVDEQHARIAVRMAENGLRDEWRSLVAVVGQPELPLRVVEGNLEENWPDINEQEVAEKIAADSPASRIADAAMTRAGVALERAKREAIPDLQVRGGLEYNNEPIAPRVATGWQGIAEVTLQVPVFNRNQGNVGAASAELDRAQLEKQRVALTMRERAAAVAEEYANAKIMAAAYRDEILPRAKKAYGMMVEKYGLMLAAAPRVIESQRKLYGLQGEYIATLERVWTAGVALQGYLLTDGLEAPARPGEVDFPVRETNMPIPERGMTRVPGRPQE